MILFSKAVISCHFSSIPLGRNLSVPAAPGAPAEAAAPQPLCRDLFSPELWLTGREALKIPHTQRTLTL